MGVQNADDLLKITTFLMYAPRFKDDIVLVSDALWPVDVPSPVLPLSITNLLSGLCDLGIEIIADLWGLLKNVVWNWEEKVQGINERYKKYGNYLGYRMFKLFLCQASEDYITG
jgi:hypothetical protein